jgi:chaperonin GroES
MVVAIGTAKLDDKDKKIEFNVKVGDKVLVSKYRGTEIKIDGENTPFQADSKPVPMLGAGS